MQYTIKDIAKLAKVSRGTVDRVLHKRGKTSSKAYDKVMKVLNEIDYEPNLLARSLKKSRIIRIAVLIPNHQNDKYWFRILKGILKGVNEFKSFGIRIEEYFFSAEDSSHFVSQSQAVFDSKPDAILLIPFFQQEALFFLEKCKKCKIEVVNLNTPIMKKNSFHFIGQELKSSGRVVASIFKNCVKGNFLIMHIDEYFENSIHMQEKEKGFREFFKDSPNNHYSIETKIFNEHPDQLEDQIAKIFDKEQKIDGIYVTTSKVYKVAEILNKLKVKTFMVGYDLIDQNVKHLKDGDINFLINQNPQAQGYLGIKSLAEYFLYDKVMESHIYLPLDIINKENYQYVLNLKEIN